MWMVYGCAGAPVKILYQGWEAGVFPLRGALIGGAPVATGWPAVGTAPLPGGSRCCRALRPSGAQRRLVVARMEPFDVTGVLWRGRRRGTTPLAHAARNHPGENGEA